MNIFSYLKKKIISIKETKIWYFFIKLIIKPFFDILWVNVINFHGRILGLIYSFNKKDFYKINKHEDVRLIENDPEFQKIANLINDYTNEDFINELKKKIEKGRNEKHYMPNFLINFFPLLPEHVKAEILKFALSEKNIVTAIKYLKVLPVIKKLIVYLNIPKLTEERGAALWHKDDFGYKSLDIFLAISDININSGPLYYLKAKKELGVFLKIKNIIKKALPGERNKVTLESFSNYFKKDEVGALMGKSGTGVFIDSFTTYHRGGYCKSENRIMLRVSYQTPDTSRGQQPNNQEEFFYYPKIKKTDIKNIFHRYILFKNRNKLLQFIKIDRIILLFIKIFHYKM